MKSFITILVVSLLLASCAITKREFNKPETGLEVPGDYLVDANDTLFTEAAVSAEWWKNFSDPTLELLIEKARNNNPDINSAVANFFGARAVLRGTRFDRFPTVTANGSYNRQRLGENVFVSGSNPEFSQYNGSFDAFWELNLFGRVSNRVKGAYAFQEAARADMRGMYVSIFAEVARNYVELRGTQYLLNIANRNLTNQQETYDLIERLVGAGTSNTLDLARAEAQLENTRASIPPLEAQIEILKNSLSVLTGEVPGSLESDVVDIQPLPTLPTTVSLGNINDMLRRRPDVTRAEHDLMQQVARYNLAVAELYPNVTFGGSIGFSAINFSSFGENRSFTWIASPQISWAAFNLGRVRRQIDQEDAYAIAAVNQYEKTMLGALQEIDNSMVNYENELSRRRILGKAFQASYEAELLAQDRYEAGLDSFLDYLNADRTLLQAEVALANSEIASVTNLIAIYKALGGGWEIVTAEELDQLYQENKEQDSTLKSNQLSVVN